MMILYVIVLELLVDDGFYVLHICEGLSTIISSVIAALIDGRIFVSNEYHEALQ